MEQPKPSGKVSKPFKAIMIGGTGATGKEVVKELLLLPNLERLVLLLRKTAKYEDPRVVVVEVNFDKLALEFEAKKEELGKADVCLSFLGTTKSLAGSAENYRKIEVDYPTAFVRMVRNQCGARHAVLMSSDGANAGSMLTYLSQKGQVEQEWRKCEFDTLTILRPGVLDRGELKNTMEKIMGVFMTPMPCTTIAKAVANRVRDIMVDDQRENKEKVWRNPDIDGYAKRLEHVDLIQTSQGADVDPY